MNTIVAVAPHPDDETYGCGGTILRHKEKGDAIHWLIMTSMLEKSGYSSDQILKREREIKTVADMYGFQSTHLLHFPPARLDQVALQDMITAIGNVFHEIKPNIVYLPYRADVHSDHRITFDAVMACTKWFRFQSIKKVLAYEALSETDFNLNPNVASFTPNFFVNINNYLDKKITIANIFESEKGAFPFPRSDQAIKSLAHFRGSLAGYSAAEAFILLREICD
jgi:LmbE family N-acetylglucosaminyl deacetylase